MPATNDFDRAGAGGQLFRGPWGVVASANITSDPDQGLGQWTDQEIKRAITQGVARDGTRLKPPMAYANYARMTQPDLDAWSPGSAPSPRNPDTRLLSPGRP